MVQDFIKRLPGMQSPVNDFVLNHMAENAEQDIQHVRRKKAPLPPAKPQEAAR
jgi:hypothetical protein